LSTARIAAALALVYWPHNTEAMVLKADLLPFVSMLLFSAHAIVRAFVALGIWMTLPDARVTLLPFSVSALYLLTVLAILIDSAQVKVPESLAD
jgi:hypothetical protein